MKRAIAYTATAVLIGFAIMMLPKALETGPPTYQPQLEPFSLDMSESRKLIEQQYGLAGPSSLLPTSLIIITGLIPAVSIYIIIKKRTS